MNITMVTVRSVFAGAESDNGFLPKSIYATLIGHSDVASPDSWVGRFMKGRAERIANDLPYVELDFSANKTKFNY
jgi:hypothetical protein